MRSTADRLTNGRRLKAATEERWRIGIGFQEVGQALRARRGDRRFVPIAALLLVAILEPVLDEAGVIVLNIANPFSPEVVRGIEDPARSAGYTLLLASGDDDREKKPDAFFIGNYLMAVGFMRALRQYQLRCPEDVAIVTCDDHPWLDSFHPRLTTVNLPKYELGQTGARALLERIEPRDTPPPKRSRTITLPTTLCLRESCGYELRRTRSE